MTVGGKMFWSFRAEDIKAMYHLPDPQKTYNKAFIADFTSSNEIESDPIKEWRRAPEKHKNETSGMYSVESLTPPYCYAAEMMCRLFGNDNSARFSIQMVPLIHVVINYEIMDWSVILFENMANRILDYKKNKNSVNTPPFHLCAYILYALCFNSKFPILGWKWTPQEIVPIHIYHKLLWKLHFKNHVYRIFHGFMLPIYHIIFNQFPPQLSEIAKLIYP